jgi:hypothetical protein
VYVFHGNTLKDLKCNLDAWRQDIAQPKRKNGIVNTYLTKKRLRSNQNAAVLGQ